MLTRSLFGWNSKRTNCPADKSYSVRSEFATNSSAALSLRNFGSFFSLFFIVLNLLPMHVTGTQHTDMRSLAPHAQGEHDKHAAPGIRPPDRLKPFLDPRMRGVPEHKKRSAKQALNLGKRNAVLLALLPIALVPLKIRNVQIHLVITFFCTPICQYIRLKICPSPTDPQFRPLNCYNPVLYCDERPALGAAHNKAKGESWL